MLPWAPVAWLPWLSSKATGGPICRFVFSVGCTACFLIIIPQREDALQLVKNAIFAGIFNDLGSGSNVDACVITATHTEMLRNVEMPNVRVQKEKKYGFRRGTTAWRTESIRNLVVSEEVTPIGGGDAMDTT